MYRLGAGGNPELDRIEALAWYQKAAKQENSEALFNLGTAYYNGDGVSVNDLSAYAWFLLAKNLGNPRAEEAVQRMKKEAGDLEPNALEKIAEMYVQGDGLPQNSSKAADWYRKAVDIGGASVKMKLANLLLHDQNVAANYPEIRSLCEKAANQHFSAGAFCVGQLYEHGFGVPVSPTEAFTWYLRAANQLNGRATLRVGEMYWNGEGVAQDKIAGYEFIYIASTSGLAEAKQEKEIVEKDLTPQELKEAKEKAAKWNHSGLPVSVPKK